MPEYGNIGAWTEMAAFTLQRTGPQGTHNVPGNNGPGGGGVARAQGGGRGSD